MRLIPQILGNSLRNGVACAHSSVKKKLRGPDREIVRHRVISFETLQISSPGKRHVADKCLGKIAADESPRFSNRPKARGRSLGRITA